jgi:two-component system phosphate regulon response regulator PhoB
LRNIVYRFEDLYAFARALRGADQELALPQGERVGDGEWVLAIFEVGAAGRGRATAAAARGLDRGAEGSLIAFERRDWERLVEFSEAQSEQMKVAKTATGPTSDSGAIPVEIEEPAPSSSQYPTQPVTPVPESRTGTRSRPMANAFGAAGKGARVLVVDDDRGIRDVVGAMLEAVGLKVDSVGSAEEALVKMRSRVPDLVVLDWNLPGMTGIELCRLLRREAKLAQVPVLFLTAHASSRDVVEAFASGADDYVSKPFRAPELGARIYGLLRRTRAPASKR